MVASRRLQLRIPAAALERNESVVPLAFALPSPHRGDEHRTVPGTTPCDTHGLIADSGQRVFCIRLHFVPEERIGIRMSSAQRLLTISEARSHPSAAPLVVRNPSGANQARAVRHEIALTCCRSAGTDQAARFVLSFAEKHSRIWIRSSSAAGPSSFLSSFQSLITSRCFSTVMSHLQLITKAAHTRTKRERNVQPSSEISQTVEPFQPAKNSWRLGISAPSDTAAPPDEHTPSPRRCCFLIFQL